MSRSSQPEGVVARGYILSILQAAVDRKRDDPESFSTYLDESIIFVRVGKRFQMKRETVRGHLYYLRDRGYVKFHEATGGTSNPLLWRITADGTDVLEGIKKDAGVYVE